MSEDLTMAEQYVLHRADGMGSREAAAAAGFSGDVPSPQARELWEVFEKVRPYGTQHAGMIRRKLEEARKKVSELRVMSRAYDLLELNCRH